MSVIMHNVICLSVVMPNVILPGVVAPFTIRLGSKDSSLIASCFISKFPRASRQVYKTTDIVKKIDRYPRRGSVPVREQALTSVGE
jgi:hypothetical protein